MPGLKTNRAKARLRAALAREQNGKCFYCHLRLHDDVTLEHVRARSRGGSNAWKNLAATHARCNSLVGSLPVSEKLRLREIGRVLGSDAFFQEVSALTRVTSKRTLGTVNGRLTVRYGGLTMTFRDVDADAERKLKLRVARQEASLQRAAGLPPPPSVKALLERR